MCKENVPFILSKSEFIHPPSVVSVDVLIINVHKSHAMALYLIKHRILNKEEVYQYKVTARDVVSTI